VSCRLVRAGLLLPISIILAASAAAQTDPLAAVRIFEGKWEGATSGKPGTGHTTREYRRELNGNFLSQRDQSVYQPAGTGTKQFLHEDLGYFSYDKNRAQVVWRQFHSEGLVNEYVLDSVTEDGKALEFVTTNIENLPGFRAKKVYRIVSPNEIEETFWLAAPGKDFELYTEAHLNRQK